VKLFISYARLDGADLAQRLEQDLSAKGDDVWLDKERLRGGDPWRREIEVAIDGSGAVVAVVSKGLYNSEVCRAELGRAFARSKRVIPARVDPECDVPLGLEQLHFIDFSQPDRYLDSFEQLVRSIEGPGTIAPRPRPEPYNNAPPLPVNFVERPHMLAGLRNALFQDAPNRNIALTAFQGMGGIGKTVMAQALCADEVVRHAYPDGIFWFPIGKESRAAFDQRVEGVPGLKQLLGSYNGLAACLSQYRAVMRQKAALIVLDDVWHAGDIEPFRAESPRSRVLITTRDTGLAGSFGARAFTAELLTEPEAREVLALWAGLELHKLPAEAGEIVKECGQLPLALAMIGAQLRGKPQPHWGIVLQHLRRADLAKIRARFAEPHTTLFRAIQVSVEALGKQDPEAARRYVNLAVTLEDMAIAPEVQQTLWNLGKTEAAETAERLTGLSLAQPVGDGGAIRLHDLQLDFVRAEHGKPESLELMRGAVRLSAHVLEKEPRQFASQVAGRLLPHRADEGIGEFVERISAGAPRPWLRPLLPALQPPGTGLVRTLEGHTHYVTGVAVTGDGQRAVSASWDGTLKVWDLEKGRALVTLEGHTSSVYGVAVTGDGQRAVSASEDKTLKVWDLVTGRVIETFYCDAPVRCCVFADASRIAAGDWLGHLHYLSLEA
jgi:hypothetical protein